MEAGKGNGQGDRESHETRPIISDIIELQHYAWPGFTDSRLTIVDFESHPRTLTQPGEDIHTQTNRWQIVYPKPHKSHE